MTEQLQQRTTVSFRGSRVRNASESNRGSVMQLYRRFANQLSYFGMYGMRTDEDLVCILMLLTSDYRLAVVKKRVQKARNKSCRSILCNESWKMH
ncbi:hypothetical protein AVEN_34261-1 [Araneus ventricosus]|uniref:Uncharacterized protein n=1 Tax=Araneus ventricosus TaxID=182803 RepID=A0A4Y2F4P1_ARAVE|nr:hypothetical protein AVEN_34261-1 [Araneus ventricosus]